MSNKIETLHFNEARWREQQERWFGLCALHRRLRPHVLFRALSNQFATTPDLDRRDEILAEVSSKLVDCRLQRSANADLASEYLASEIGIFYKLQQEKAPQTKPRPLVTETDRDCVSAKESLLPVTTELIDLLLMPVVSQEERISMGSPPLVWAIGRTTGTCRVVGVAAYAVPA